MSVFKDEHNGSWYVKLRYTDWTGKHKDTTKRGFKTRREAVQWEADFKARQSGSIDMTFGEFVRIYEEERFPRLKKNTQAMKENIIDTKILPYFRDIKLNAITPAMIIKWQNDLIKFRDPMSGEHYKSSYLKTVHNQLSAILNYAVRYYNLPNNAAAIAGNMGDEYDIKTDFWTPDEYKQFAEVMMDEPVYYYAFETLYWLGVREGEMFALTEEDFDFDKMTVSITKTYQVVKGEPMITKPKTPQSVRTIKMPENYAEEIQDYMEMLPQHDADFRIFSFITKSALIRRMESGAKKAGLKPIRVHDLRHSHVSLLISLGFSAVAIAKRMGHKSVNVTYRYAHLFPDAQTDMAGQLNDVMGPRASQDTEGDDEDV